MMFTRLTAEVGDTAVFLGWFSSQGGETSIKII